MDSLESRRFEKLLCSGKKWPLSYLYLYLHFLQSYIQLEVFLLGIDPKVSELWKKIRFESNWHESNHARLQGFDCCSPRNSIDQIASLATQGFVTLAKVFFRSGRGWEQPRRVSKISDSNVFVSFTFSGIIVNVMGVSKNNGTPKSSILVGFSIINHPFWGTPIFGNTLIVGVFFFLHFLHLKLMGQGAGSNWQAQRQSAITGSGGPDFFWMWNLGSFCFGKGWWIFLLGWEVTVCQVYRGLGVEVFSVFVLGVNVWLATSKPSPKVGK